MANALLLLILSAVSVETSLWESPCTIRSVDRRYTPAYRCLACHDGTAGPAVSFSSSDSSGEHPVGMEYAESFARGPARGLRPPGSIDARLVLPHGTVSCVTCHDGTSPNHLAVPMDRLCESCHDL